MVETGFEYGFLWLQELWKWRTSFQLLETYLESTWLHLSLPLLALDERAGNVEGQGDVGGGKLGNIMDKYVQTGQELRKLSFPIWNASFQGKESGLPNTVPLSSRSRVGKPQPMCQILPATCFCMAWERRTFCFVFNGWKNQKVNSIFMIYENFRKFKCHYP